MKNKFLSSLLAIFSLFTVPAETWWDGGHMVVAQIAQDHITPEVRKKVDALFLTFSEHYPDHDQMVTAATWMDYIKTDRGLKAFDEWHYTDIPYDPRGLLSKEQLEQILAANKANDIHRALHSALRTLAHPKALRFEKAFMLNVLIHCVGDIHCPVHCCSRYTHDHPNGDSGGNLFKIAGQPVNTLHQLWDSGIYDFPYSEFPASQEDLVEITEYAKQLEEKYPPKYFPDSRLFDPGDWSKESYKLAVEVAYGSEEGKPLTEEYVHKARRVSQERVTLAGYRLALLLNQLFSPEN